MSLNKALKHSKRTCALKGEGYPEKRTKRGEGFSKNVRKLM